LRGIGEGVDLGLAGWWAGRVGGSVGLVGRERELSCLSEALSGEARLLLVVGTGPTLIRLVRKSQTHENKPAGQRPKARESP